ncbi:MAG: hypothetical protein IJR71_01625 [Prevotella sp.]|nr:hypothetical protein [Prevotella sp.]
MGMRFKQAVRIGSNVTDIMKLECVKCVTKQPCPETTGYKYHLYDGNIAVKGDWLCEDYAGQWHILKDNEYQQIIKTDNE